MIFINTIILTLTICIDSFILCFINKNKNKSNYFYIPIIFSFFQTSFLLIGYFLGDILEIYLQNYLKHIIFLIFSSMGLKLIIDTLLNKGNEKICYFTLKNIFLQAVITSLDSIFLGVPFAFENMRLVTLTIIISLTTIIASLLGLILRSKLNNTYDDKISIGGSIILFIFAFKSLI